MDGSKPDQSAIRRYLLGALDDEAKQEQIEEQLVTDEEFADELQAAEDLLIEDYLCDKLTTTERQQFESFFLSVPQRRSRFQLVQGVRRVALRAPVGDSLQELVLPPPEGFWDKIKHFFIAPKGLFQKPAFRFAVLAIVVGTIGIVIWRVGIRDTDVDKGLAQLHDAYRVQRPLDSRISDFPYVPFPDQRGGEVKSRADQTALDRAQSLLLYSVSQQETGRSLHALGQFYLAQQDLDRAIDYFEKALILSPENPKLESDLGATLLEKGKQAVVKKSPSEGMRFFDESLSHLKTAIKLNPKLFEPRFNLALNLEFNHFQEQAKQAWHDYIALDPNSSWTREAQDHLKLLELKKTQDRSANEIEQEFLTAFRQSSDVAAGQLIGANRELIGQKYIPQKLAMSLVEASGSERGEYQRALAYAGQLENTNIGDPFASDLNAFYKSATDGQIESLKNAQIAMRNGYAACLNTDFEKALEHFKSARARFLQNKDHNEAVISELFILYCQVKLDLFRDSLELAQRSSAFCETRNYKWLNASIRTWYAAAQRATGQPDEAKENVQQGLALAEQIRDAPLTQLILMSLAQRSGFIGEFQIALGYLNQAFETADAANSSLRQKWRNYSDGAELLADANLLALAKAAAIENILMIRNHPGTGYEVYSEIDAGIVHSRANEIEESEKWFNSAQQTVAQDEDGPQKRSILTKTAIELGHLARKRANYEQAETFYRQAEGYAESSEDPHTRDLYEINKGKLFVYAALDNDDLIESQLTKTMELAEQYRNQLPTLREFADERERVSFLSNQQPIYNLAIGNNFKHARFEQAYSYLESSNSRSLLNWLQRNADNKDEFREAESTYAGSVSQVNSTELRKQLPERVQILQFAVLEDRVLIFLLTKKSLIVKSSPIGAAELQSKIRAYLELINAPNEARSAETDELGGELYRLLIAPMSSDLEVGVDICLIPQDILIRLPFAALLGPDGKPFVAQHNLFYSPSAKVMLICTRIAQQKVVHSTESILSVGNPDFDKGEFSQLRDLPEAEDEANAIAELYTNPRVLVGGAATKRSILSLLPEINVLQFAGHYVINPNDPLDSRLVLAADGKDPADGSLSNAEVSRLNLPRARLVVLSACQTGVENYYRGEGLVGLSRTFLAAGVPLVVASLWPVDSTSTAELMKRFHFYRRLGKNSTVEALRRAQKELFESADGRYRNPYYWAGFSAFGGKASF